MWVGGLAARRGADRYLPDSRFTSVKIPIGPFFLVTSIVMAALVVIFAGGGIHALIEGDLIEGTYLSSVPTNDWIGLYPYVETITAQVIGRDRGGCAVRGRFHQETQDEVGPRRRDRLSKRQSIITSKDLEISISFQRSSRDQRKGREHNEE